MSRQGISTLLSCIERYLLIYCRLLDLKFVIDTLADNQTEFVPRGKVRIACVAAVIRWRPYIMDNIDLSQPLAASALDFLNQPWVNDCHGEAEVLFIRRAKRPGDLYVYLYCQKSLGKTLF